MSAKPEFESYDSFKAQALRQLRHDLQHYFVDFDEEAMIIKIHQTVNGKTTWHGVIQFYLDDTSKTISVFAKFDDNNFRTDLNKGNEFTTLQEFCGLFAMYLKKRLPNRAVLSPVETACIKEALNNYGDAVKKWENEISHQYNTHFDWHVAFVILQNCMRAANNLKSD